MRRSYGVGATRAALAGTCCRGRRGATIGTAAGVGVSVADREERPDVPRGRMGEGVPRGRSGPTARVLLVATEVAVTAARAGVPYCGVLRCSRLPRASRFLWAGPSMGLFQSSGFDLSHDWHRPSLAIGKDSVMLLKT